LKGFQSYIRATGFPITINRGNKIETFFFYLLQFLNQDLLVLSSPKKGSFQSLQRENLAIGTVLFTMNIFGDTSYVGEFGEYRQRMKDGWEQ